MKSIVEKNPNLENPYRYINMDYINMNKNSSEYKLLEKLKEFHLENQIGLNNRSKLGLDIARFRKSNLEILQTKGIAGKNINALTAFAQEMRSTLLRSKDDFERGLNVEEQRVLVNMDIFDDEMTSKIPIRGKYNMELDEVSLDILSGIDRYQLSAEEQKQLIKISPIAKALSDVLNDPKNQPIKTINGIKKIQKKMYQNYGVETAIRGSKKDRSIRAKTVDDIIERDFHGLNLTGRVRDMPILQKTVRLLQKNASY